jgi:hypothetical protein
LKSLDHFPIVVFVRRRPSLPFYQEGGIGMNSRILGYLAAGALTAALALAPPAFARGGGGGGMHGGGMGGGMHGGMGGGMGGGMHGGMGGGMHVGGMGGGMHTGGMHFGGARFAGAPFAHAGFSPRFSRVAFHDGFHHRFFHHRFHRFAVFGVPYAYAAYDSCWRRVWTPYGVQWVDVCGGNGYY